MVDQFVILVDAERAVRRQTLHRERAGDADDAPILVRLVVQVLEVRLGGDGVVDLLLPRDARLPPAAVQVSRTGAPRVARLAGNIVKGVVAAQSVVQNQQCVGFLRVGLGRLQPFPRCRCRLRPRLAGLSRDVPILPRAAKCAVQLCPKRLQSFLPPLPDHVDLGVVSDRLQFDVGHSLIHEALPDVTARGTLVDSRTERSG